MACHWLARPVSFGHIPGQARQVAWLLIGAHRPCPRRYGREATCYDLHVSIELSSGVLTHSRSLACLVVFLAPTLWCSSWVPWLRAVPILVTYFVVVVLIRYVAS